MRSALLTVALFAFLFAPQPALGATIIDFSPDTTGAPLGESSYTNRYGTQIVGDRFTLTADTTLTGGSIFSSSFFGSVGDPARFMIFADLAGTPAPLPTVDIVTTVDVVDTQFTTSQPSLTRKHATITPTFLAAGTYWFSLPGNTGTDLAQAATTSAGGYDDGQVRFGPTNLVNSASVGDMYFQLEGDQGLSAVPEPSSLALFGLGAAGLAAGAARRRLRRAA